MLWWILWSVGYCGPESTLAVASTRRDMVVRMVPLALHEVRWIESINWFQFAAAQSFSQIFRPGDGNNQWIRDMFSECCVEDISELVSLYCSRLVFSMNKDWFHIAITFRFRFGCFTGNSVVGIFEDWSDLVKVPSPIY